MFTINAHLFSKFFFKMKYLRKKELAIFENHKLF